MFNKTYYVSKELFDTDDIYSIGIFRDILAKWYTEIVWNVNLSWDDLQSLAEFSKYKYRVVWTFDVSNNQLTSFEGFPTAAKHLICTWNNIKSLDWIPGFDYCKLDNYFYSIEEVVPDLIYKYWDEYFLIDKKSYRLSNIEHLQSIDNYRPDLSKRILESYDYDVKDYIDTLNKVRSTSGVIDIGKFIKVNNKIYSKEALDPTSYKNWVDLEFFEVKEINWWLVKVKWKLFNKKLSKLL